MEYVLFPKLCVSHHNNNVNNKVQRYSQFFENPEKVDAGMWP